MGAVLTAGGWGEVLKAILLGVVQGITEWLPISSTGHMILLGGYLQLQVSTAFWNLFLVVVQFGSILAVFTLYFHQLNPFSFTKTSEQKKQTWKLYTQVLVAALPAAAAGFLFEDVIEKYLYSPLVVAIALVAYGIIFVKFPYVNRQVPSKIQSTKDLGYRQALAIGLCQMLALVPGTSRSGATILGALLLGCTPAFASEFSFFLAIPVMAGASGLKIVKYAMEFGWQFESGQLLLLADGMIAAFLVSVVVIRGLLAFVKNHNFKPFGWYRIGLGGLILLSIFAGGGAI